MLKDGTKSGGRKASGPLDSNLRPVEHNLFLLMASPGEWIEVDRFVRRHHSTSGGSSAMWTALRRRGCEMRMQVVKQNGRGQSLVSVLARWVHPVPTEPVFVSEEDFDDD